MMMALAERFIALAGHHVGSPSVAFMRDNTAQSIRHRSENTYAIDFRDATLAALDEDTALHGRHVHE